MELRVRISCGNNRSKKRVDLPLAFEGERVFAIWDTADLGDFQLLARIELNPRLLKRLRGRMSKNIFRYIGKLDLPQPENN